MKHVHTVEQVRAAEADLMTRVPEGTLMQRASYGLATHIATSLSPVYGARVALLVGAGGNGGDALWAGFFLRRRGCHVTAVLTEPDKAWPDGLAALRRAGGIAVPTDDPAAVVALERADVVVDGLVGLGARGGVRLPQELLDALGGAPVVAVDTPSGVGVDTGEAFDPGITADLTVTFGTYKPAHVLAPARERVGEVALVDIGLDLPAPYLRVLEPADVRRRWPVQGYAGTKYTLGVVGVVAGSDAYPGAGVLSTGGALHAKSGMVRYVGRGPHAGLVRARWPEVVSSERIEDAGRVQAWVVGPGVGTSGDGEAAVHTLLDADEPVVFDADAITVLAKDRDALRRRRGTSVLTPHAGEFERLFGVVGTDPVTRVREVAAAYGAVVLLKGPTTIVADPEGTVFVNPTGTSDLGTAGTGDVLSGMVGALVAASEVTGVPTVEAVACAAFVHGLCGSASRRPVVAEDLIAALPRVLDELLS